MATTHLRREKFDRDREFVVSKKLTIRGDEKLIGGSFDKHSVSARRLRQLYDSRYIAMAPPADTGLARADPERMTDNQLQLFLEDNGIVPRYGPSRPWLIRKVKELLRSDAGRVE